MGGSGTGSVQRPALVDIQRKDIPKANAGAAEWARMYADYGAALLPGIPGEKRPHASGWEKPTAWIADPDAAERYWTQHEDDLIGVNLGGSLLCSLDIDNEPETRRALEAIGMD